MKSIKVSFRIVLAVVAVATVGCSTPQPSATKSQSKTVVGNVRLFAPGDLTNAACSLLWPNMGPARFPYTAVNLLLANGSGEVIATGGLLGGKLDSKDHRFCVYPISIPDVPEVAIYNLTFDNYYPQFAWTESLRKLQDANWVWQFG